uniref:Uncharacterized protein n=1 Tax=Ralstonia solanacearum CFBP2957 TaxID=859656 RepID=D8P3K3_RALSL|nr:protein of unknown function [Ralstonia solanacearum CFBP2957]
MRAPEYLPLSNDANVVLQTGPLRSSEHDAFDLRATALRSRSSGLLAARTNLSIRSAVCARDRPSRYRFDRCGLWTGLFRRVLHQKKPSNPVLH